MDRLINAFIVLKWISISTNISWHTKHQTPTVQPRWANESIKWNSSTKETFKIDIRNSFCARYVIRVSGILHLCMMLDVCVCCRTYNHLNASTFRTFSVHILYCNTAVCHTFVYFHSLSVWIFSAVTLVFTCWISQYVHCRCIWVCVCVCKSIVWPHKC